MFSSSQGDVKVENVTSAGGVKNGFKEEQSEEPPKAETSPKKNSCTADSLDSSVDESQSEEKASESNLENSSYHFDFYEILDGDRPNASLIMAEALLAGGICEDGASSSAFQIQESAKAFFNSELQPLIKDRFAAANWMREKRLLAQSMCCSVCLLNMSWAKHTKCGDGYSWKCHNTSCARYKYTKSIRNGSLFHRSHISLSKWIHVMYLWANEEDLEVAALLLDLSSKIMVDAYRYFREICCWYFEKNPIQLGGEGKTCHFDLIPSSSRKRKLDAVKDAEPVQYFIGIVEENTEPLYGYLEMVEDLSPEAVYSVVEGVVQKGTTVTSRQPETFQNVQEQKKKEAKKDLSSGTGSEDTQELKFVMLGKVENEKEIEKFWRKQKKRIKNLIGMRAENRRGYIAEYMWRDRFSTDAFNKLCGHIADKYAF